MSIYHEPWRLVQNQIRGRGGREIDKFRGVTPPQDTRNGSEAWIGSTTHVEKPPEDKPYYGCSEVMLPDGRRTFLFQAIQENPEEVLGKRHMAVNGTDIGVLVKYLDAQEQYGLQCHPTREWAMEKWGQSHGKAESWYVIGTRDDTPEPAYILLGFKDGVTREDFEKYYYAGDICGLESLCHKIPVQKGDSFFLGGGVPHALGRGCFVIEVQEPQDITLMWWNYQLTHEFLKKGVTEEEYDERLLGAFIYDGCSYEENLRRWKTPHDVMRSGDWGREEMIVGPKHTTYFSFSEITLDGETEIVSTGFPQIGIVREGSGKLLWNGGEMSIAQGDEVFFPVDIPGLYVRGQLHLVLCNPEGTQE